MVKSEGKSVRVRFAPSPTGPLHIGGVRTAMFNWIFARQNKGAFILRIEDTDKTRSEKKYELQIFEGLKWLGLDWDEGPIAFQATADKRGSKNSSRINADGNISVNQRNHRRTSATGQYGPYRQSERIEIYEKYLEQLLAEKKAYYCYCTKDELEAERQVMLAQGLPPKYSGHCRNIKEPPAGKKPQVIRFVTPEAKVEFKDIIRGKVSFDAGLFGDIVIARLPAPLAQADGGQAKDPIDTVEPLYNFAVVVDDALMEVSHVVRGEEHLSNTPKQILFQKALGFSVPEYAHLPLILNPDRSKMSKRFSDTALSEYKDRGYLPEAIVNFLSLLGWHPQDDTEIFTLDKLVGIFDLKRVQKSGAVFNQEKLDWLQREYLKRLSVGEIADRLEPILKEKEVAAERSFLEKVIEVERPRMTTFRGFLDAAGFFFKLPDYDPSLLIWQKQQLPTKTKEILKACADILEKEKVFAYDALFRSLDGLTGKEGRGAVLWPLRAALSGLAASPDPLQIAEILGKKETLARIQTAVTKIDKLR
ncbi:MAG: glutamate--tRNA ligase [Candidatus Liptonbacteria bacterium]|nr:glutamate--tRNA ligase [Candidatus Liptonbacteria bacterium]